MRPALVHHCQLTDWHHSAYEPNPNGEPGICYTKSVHGHRCEGMGSYVQQDMRYLSKFFWPRTALTLTFSPSIILQQQAAKSQHCRQAAIVHG